MVLSSPSLAIGAAASEKNLVGNKSTEHMTVLVVGTTTAAEIKTIAGLTFQVFV